MSDVILPPDSNREGGCAAMPGYGVWKRLWRFLVPCFHPPARRQPWVSTDGQWAGWKCLKCGWDETTQRPPPRTITIRAVIVDDSHSADLSRP